MLVDSLVLIGEGRGNREAVETAVASNRARFGSEVGHVEWLKGQIDKASQEVTV